MLLIPIIAALATAFGVILDKIILTYQKVGHRQFLIIIFLFLFLTCGLLYPFLGIIKSQAFSFQNILFLSLVVILASIYNILFYHAIEKEKIVEVELFLMLLPLSTILLASIFLKGERNFHIILSGLIASLALIFSHLKKYHLSFSVFQKGLFVYLLIVPIEAILIKKLLSVYSPLALYGIRTFFIFLVLYIWYKFFAPSLKGEPEIHFKSWRGKHYLHCFLISIVAIIQMVLTFYAYRDLGVIFTTLVLILAPLFIYLSAIIFLHEKLKKRIILAAFVIIACIIYANLNM